ncbi:T9SS type A sorting domain-containing protein [Flavobacterium sp. HXWNR29]|uniref:T9SS type A sorting domain-containing protein n=1 Tax=Flavobacterium odoriferum TaxID=2946604 RepID=UPI0021CB73DC|nr:T9SS type A sorting domain-containing protein [Flavobacterium sp. HXWNR29]MCU4187575.1 T9SS type A sorting domain-containing protein [Flavobacterium sp. HXWNR29]
MKLISLSSFILLISLNSFAQDKIIFEYDSAGNQIVRRYCPTCSESKNSQNNIEDELLKFFPEDIISYYPNPVRDELFLKWDLINNNYVNEIQMFDINAKLISTISDLKNTDRTTIQFSSLPKNLYLIILVFNNGESKSIKITKE